MRSVLAIMLTALVLCGCSGKMPPAGRWEGTYESADTLVAARLQINSKGEVFVSAPDATNIGSVTGADRGALRQRLAQGLATAWSDVPARRYDYDGTTFRKPGGIAPQMEWRASDNSMTMYVYLGTDTVKVPLHPVQDFSDDPWPRQ